MVAAHCVGQALQATRAFGAARNGTVRDSVAHQITRRGVVAVDLASALAVAFDDQGLARGTVDEALPITIHDDAGGLAGINSAL